MDPQTADPPIPCQLSLDLPTQFLFGVVTAARAVLFQRSLTKRNTLAMLEGAAESGNPKTQPSIRDRYSFFFQRSTLRTKQTTKPRPHTMSYVPLRQCFLSQWENLKLSWLPYLVIRKTVGIFFPSGWRTLSRAIGPCLGSKSLFDHINSRPGSDQPERHLKPLESAPRTAFLGAP